MSTPKLSKREQQVMDILYAGGALTASDVQEALPDAPTNSAVRSILRMLLKKGHITRRQDGFRYLYEPAVETHQAGRRALRDLMQTFFAGSPQKAFVELLDISKDQMAEDDFDRMRRLIEQAEREGR